MNYQQLRLRCECGETPDRIVEVGFTDTHRLVITWWCSRCEGVVWLAKSLSDCWLECPRSGESLEHRLERLGLTGAAGDGAADAQFLKSLGIKATTL